MHYRLEHIVSIFAILLIALSAILFTLGYEQMAVKALVSFFVIGTFIPIDRLHEFGKSSRANLFLNREERFFTFLLMATVGVFLAASLIFILNWLGFIPSYGIIRRSSYFGECRILTLGAIFLLGILPYYVGKHTKQDTIVS